MNTLSLFILDIQDRLGNYKFKSQVLQGLANVVRLERMKNQNESNIFILIRFWRTKIECAF